MMQLKRIGHVLLLSSWWRLAGTLAVALLSQVAGGQEPTSPIAMAGPSGGPRGDYRQRSVVSPHSR